MMNLPRVLGRRCWFSRASLLGIVALGWVHLESIPPGVAATAAPPGAEKKTEGKRKIPPSLASLPAPKAGGPLRILLVDDDWSDNNGPGGTGRPSGSDEIFRELVTAAVGGNAASWSVETAERNRNGPAFGRLRDFNVVLWYTGGSYGGGPDNSAVLSIEDEKTAEREIHRLFPT